MDPVAPVASAPAIRPQTPEAQTPEARAAESFEAVFIATFLGEMLEQARPKTMGGGAGEQMFGGLMAQEIAAEIARSGGLGLAQGILAQLDAYRR